MPHSASKSTIVRARPGLPAFGVHPLSPEAAGHAVDAVFAQLSPRSRYLRFHSPVHRLTGPVRAGLVDLDGRCRAAVVAVVGGPDGWHGPRPVGIARLARSGPASVEVAVAVADAWQRRGIGSRLVTAIAELAESLGYTTLSGAVLPENVAMLGLVRRIFPWVLAHYDGDVVQLRIRLGPAAWTITDEDLMAGLTPR
jgi:GNAT superfamily N-acetyltransferase